MKQPIENNYQETLINQILYKFWPYNFSTLHFFNSHLLESSVLTILEALKIYFNSIYESLIAKSDSFNAIS